MFLDSNMCLCFIHDSRKVRWPLRIIMPLQATGVWPFRNACIRLSTHFQDADFKNYYKKTCYKQNDSYIFVDFVKRVNFLPFLMGQAWELSNKTDNFNTRLFVHMDTVIDPKQEFLTGCLDRQLCSLNILNYRKKGSQALSSILEDTEIMKRVR